MVPDVTSSVIVHVVFAATVPPDKLTRPLPSGAAVPPQVLTTLAGVATTTPDGRPSVTLTPVRAVPAFGLVIVKLREEMVFAGIVDGVNAFVMVGGATACP